MNNKQVPIFSFLFLILIFIVQGCDTVQDTEVQKLRRTCSQSYPLVEDQTQCSKLCDELNAQDGDITLVRACRVGQDAYLVDYSRDSVLAADYCKETYSFTIRSEELIKACLKGIGEEAARSKALGISSDRETGN